MQNQSVLLVHSWYCTQLKCLAKCYHLFLHHPCSLDIKFTGDACHSSFLYKHWLIQNSILRHLHKYYIYREKSVLHAINTFSYHILHLYTISEIHKASARTILHWNSYQFLNRESYWILVVQLSQPHCIYECRQMA